MRLPILLFTLGLFACRTSPAAADSSYSLDEHSHSRPWEVAVTHAELDLEILFNEKRLSGTVRLDLKRSDPKAALFLDAQGLDIQGVVDDTGQALKLQISPEHDALGSEVRIELGPDSTSVTIQYRTDPASEALQWLSPEQTAGGHLPFLFSQGEPVLTRSWIPLQDTPGVRITYGATLHAPEGFVTVMSATQSTTLPDGSRRFDMPHAIPPYLIALASGDLVFGELSQRCGVWADPTILERAVSELEDTETMIQSAEELFGPYRWGRYDILVLPPAFPYGGMENPCLTFATPTILTGDKSLVSLIAHELAHSWSGNLVTNATWSDFWLNEGFTVYFESRIMERVYGRERAVMENALAYDDLIQELSVTPEADTILHIDLTGRHPDDGFSGIPYNKGALFLRRLEQVYGRPAFDIFLRQWFDGHAFQSVTTADFVSFLEKRLMKNSSSETVDVERWIYGPGLPATAPVEESLAMQQVSGELQKLIAAPSDVDALETAGWVTQQWLQFIQNLPEQLSTEALLKLDSTFGWTRSGNSEILCVWFQQAIHRGYPQADESIRRFLLRVGRTKFLKPIYAALMQADPKRARAIYREARSHYHAASTTQLDAIVTP